jgi:hypothetical protein
LLLALPKREWSLEKSERASESEQKKDFRGWRFARPVTPRLRFARSDAQSWLVNHWLYFYRNQRQLTAVEWMGDLDDLNTHLEETGMKKAAQTKTDRVVAGGAGAEYERASTGQQASHVADVRAAQRVLGMLGIDMSTADAKRDTVELAKEVGRLRHHAELTAMMCLGFRNAHELALAIIEQSDPNKDGASGRDASDTQSLLQHALKAEQRTLIKEMLDTFGHASRRATLPTGTVAECLA